jgi:phosphoglycerate kinase
MKSIRDLKLTGKRILLRADFNVPMDDQGQITDDIRIRMVLPTIDHILKEKGKLVICSHMGRPKGKRVEEYSLAPVARHLETLLAVKVELAPDCIGDAVEAIVANMDGGDVLLLENLRFHEEETENDPIFSKQLANLADVYINDAFAVSHRAHASVAGVAEYVSEKAAGYLLETEIDFFNKAMREPVRPLVALVGGAKVSSKLGALAHMLDTVDSMLIGGAMANTFLKSMGVDVGNSKVEEDLLDTAKEFLENADARGVKLYFPVDFVVADAFSADAVTKHVTFRDIPPGWMALDIGPASTILFQEALQDAKTIIWNGPMGAFEMDAFARGTMALCQSVATSHALSIVGGGDTNAAVKKAGEEKNISYMSTGGGAFLALMEGKTLPGCEALASKQFDNSGEQNG